MSSLAAAATASSALLCPPADGRGRLRQPAGGGGDLRRARERVQTEEGPGGVPDDVFAAGRGAGEGGRWLRRAPQGVLREVRVVSQSASCFGRYRLISVK